MKKNGLWCLLLGMVLASGCAGSRKMVKTFSGAPGEIVEAEGVAPIMNNDLINARKAALADAQKSAVELVVGVYVSAETMVQKAVTIKSDILARTEGYITRYDILKEGEEGKFYKVRIKALVKLEEINHDLDELGLLVTPEEAGNPRISIIIEEEIDGSPSESGDAEMALFQAFLNANYPMIESTTLSETEVESALSGDASFYRAIGEKLKVEILIIGAVSAGLVTTEGLGGFISYRASTNLKAIRCGNGKVLVTASDVQSGVDITRNIAAAKALKQAARKSGEKIAHELAAKIQQQSVVVIEVGGISSITMLREFQNFLDKLSEVKSVQVRKYAEGKADIDVYMQEGTPQDIAEHLTKTPLWNVDVQSVSAYDLNVSLEEK